MKAKLPIALFLGLLISAFPTCAQDKVKSRDELLRLVNGLKYQQGEIKLKGSLAKLTVPKEFSYLSPEDAETVLVKLWGNPPGEKSLGLLMPADKTPVDEDCWVVMISYAEDGYVKDGDASKINYDDLLKTMQKDAKKASAQRVKEGYTAVELVGWAEPPHYDADAHKLYWAKELKFADQPENTLNYNIRMLGRRGVLVLNAVAPMSKLDAIEKETPQILGMVNFIDGNRYVDFDPKVDKVATYGIAALVAGGIAAKLGLFKVFWVFLLAAKKFIIIGVVAMCAWFKRIFSRSKNNGM